MSSPKETAHQYAAVAAMQLVVDLLLADLFARTPNPKAAHDRFRDFVAGGISQTPVPGFDAAWSDLVSQLVQENVEGHCARALDLVKRFGPSPDKPTETAKG